MSGDRWFSGDVAENSLQPGTDLACDRRERGVSDHAKHLLGRDGTHIGLPVENKHRDVARQQRAKLWLRGQGLVRKLGIAGAEDRVRLSLDTELGGKSGLDIDLRQDAKPLVCQCCAGPGKRVIKARVQSPALGIGR